MLRFDTGVPLWRQIYDQLRDAIVTKRLRGGVRLPASRTLAADLVVSRNSVTAAYDQLRAEGYVEQRERNGTFIAAVIPDVVGRPQRSAAVLPVAVSTPVPVAAPGPLLSTAGSVLVASARALASPGSGFVSAGTPVPFRMGDPALNRFPTDIWARILARRWRLGRMPLGYPEPAGYRPLREAIATYVGTSRGVRCVADQVFVLSATQQALDLTMRLVLRPDDSVWMEDPGHPGARAAIEASGAKLVLVPVDADGMDVAAAKNMAASSRLAFVTPSHQFPTGGVMNLHRRLDLLAWAGANDAWIIEDDYDSEFRYASRPLPSLQGLDSSDRVIYVGTFSKTLLPALRLAFVVVPPRLVESFAAACLLAGRHAPTETQVAVTDFITEGHFDRHLRRMRALYAERQGHLLDAATQHLADWVECTPSGAGMHLVGWLREGVGEATPFVDKARRAGVEIASLSSFARRPLARDALLFGYGAFESEQIRRGVATLRGAFGRT